MRTSSSLYTDVTVTRAQAGGEVESLTAATRVHRDIGIERRLARDLFLFVQLVHVAPVVL